MRLYVLLSNSSTGTDLYDEAEESEELTGMGLGDDMIGTLAAVGYFVEVLGSLALLGILAGSDSVEIWNKSYNGFKLNRRTCEEGGCQWWLSVE